MWVAVLYCPWLPVYGMILQQFMFYITMWSLDKFGQASEHPFEDESGTGTLFVMLSTVGVAFVP